MAVHAPVARQVVRLLCESGITLKRRGRTGFGELIAEGVIGDVKDGSVDELLAATRISCNGIVRRGPSARSVIVVETPIVGVPLPRRIQAHSAVIASYQEL